jgi:hypothetical protein
VSEAGERSLTGRHGIADGPIRLTERHGGQEMTGEDLCGRPHPLERDTEALVEPRPPRRAEPFVEGFTHDGMGEAETVLSPLEEPGPTGRIERVEDRVHVVAARNKDVDPELLADRGRDVEYLFDSVR